MKKFSYSLVLVLLVAYVFFQARHLILGPVIHVERPEDNSVVDPGVVIVSGTVENVASLALNDRLIYTDTAGHWQEKLIVSPGLNIIKLNAKDRFGRSTEKRIRVVFN